MTRRPSKSQDLLRKMEQLLASAPDEHVGLIYVRATLEARVAGLLPNEELGKALIDALYRRMPIVEAGDAVRRAMMRTLEFMTPADRETFYRALVVASRPLPSRKCAGCTKQIPVSGRRRYCTPECAARTRLQRWRERRRGQLRRVSCSSCGRSYLPKRVPVAGRRHYCEDCGLKTARRDAAAAYRARQSERRARATRQAPGHRARKAS